MLCFFFVFLFCKCVQTNGHDISPSDEAAPVTGLNGDVEHNGKSESDVSTYLKRFSDSEKSWKHF